MSIPKFSDADLMDIHPGIVRHKKKKEKDMSPLDYDKWKLQEMKQAHRRHVHRDRLDDYGDQVERDAKDLFRQEAIEWMEWQIGWAEQ